MPGLAQRRVTPEILDELPGDDPLAVAARRDLVLVNYLMFNRTIMARMLLRHQIKPPRRVLEIGAGDGSFVLGVANRLAPRWQGVELVLLDRANLVTQSRLDAFGALGWRAEAVAAEVADWLQAEESARFDVVAANLFLHHFTDAELARLFSALRRIAPVFVATEPRRSGFANAASRLLWAVGANRVTRHDAPASVRAGFRDAELSALWPGKVDRVEERGAGLFTHGFAATRDRSEGT